jgi:hypothetical protein
MIRLLPALLVPLLLGGAAARQAPPGCTAAEHRQFDFWIGDWTVTDSAGTAALGTNQITREEAGCLLHEHWRGGQGGTGQSFNFYNRQTGRWEQVWVASGGNVLRLAGGLQGKSMVLEGDAVSPAGAAIRNRIAWTPEPDGRVRQVWSTSTDGGKSWRVTFDGWYRKKPAS